MSLATTRHNNLRRLFRGEVPGRMYHEINLIGQGRNEIELLSYLALYTEKNVVYHQAQPRKAPTKRKAVEQVCTARLPTERQSPCIRAGSHHDTQMWGIGVQQVQRHGLPLVLVTWILTLDSATRPKVTLWYPSVVQPQWALNHLTRSLVR